MSELNGVFEQSLSARTLSERLIDEAMRALDFAQRENLMMTEAASAARFIEAAKKEMQGFICGEPSTRDGYVVVPFTKDQTSWVNVTASDREIAIAEESLADLARKRAAIAKGIWDKRHNHGQ